MLDRMQSVRYNIQVAARYSDRNFEVWLSLVERFVRDEEAAGSNPVTSTIKGSA